MLTVNLEKGCMEVLCTIHVSICCEITSKEKAKKKKDISLDNHTQYSCLT